MISTTGRMAAYVGTINPFRYRGYVYDDETGLYYLQSRYYNPEMGRFINADSVTDGSAGILGYNIFVYCANNPVNSFDFSGHGLISFIKKAVNSVKTAVAKGLTYVIAMKAIATAKIKNVFTKKNGTTSVGFAGNASFIASLSVSVGAVRDSSGNKSLIATASGGGGTPSAFFGGYYTTTTAPTISKLNGISTVTGGSVCIAGFSIGYEHSIFTDKDDPNIKYHGDTFLIGVGPAVDLEYHGQIGYSQLVPIENVFWCIVKLY